jgi:hypothetical protein
MRHRDHDDLLTLDRVDETERESPDECAPEPI